MEARYSLVSLFEQNKEELVKQLSGLDLLTESGYIFRSIPVHFPAAY